MAFSRFRYHPDAEEGLAALFERGAVVFAELKRRIALVQRQWEPEDNDDSEFVVPFEDVFLIFTVAEEDSSTLILAGIEPQPRA